MTEDNGNRQILIDYLQGGSRGADLGRIGVELEHIILDEDGETVPYEEKHGRVGVKDILDRLTEYYPDVVRTADGDILGCSRQLSAVSIEPAAQLELSLAPMTTVAEVEQEYRNFLFRLRQITGDLDYEVATVGYNPSSRAEDLQLIPKPRYQYMDEYFHGLEGMHAERMMRASASLQVSIDYADEEDAVRKMRIASLLGPILSFITDNCPVFEGVANGEALRRLHIWREVDPARCGIVPGLFDEGFGFGAYADWLLSAPPIFITRPEDHSTGTMTAAEAYADAPMSPSDVEHLLSMFWPDVRFKRYVEIRVADSLPLEPALGYVALIKGLFYGPANLDLLEGFLGVRDDLWPYDDDTIEQAISAITADGFDALVYGRHVNDWIDLLFQLAPAGLGTEAEYLEGLKDFRGL